LSVEDIQCQLQELYGVDISSSLISTVTASVLDDVKAWQSRVLDSIDFFRNLLFHGKLKDLS